MMMMIGKIEGLNRSLKTMEGKDWDRDIYHLTLSLNYIYSFFAFLIAPSYDRVSITCDFVGRKMDDYPMNSEEMRPSLQISNHF